VFLDFSNDWKNAEQASRLLQIVEKPINHLFPQVPFGKIMDGKIIFQTLEDDGVRC
jgi:hypothetical protein